MNANYIVEFEGDDGAVRSIEYGQNLAAAASRARRASEKHSVAFVVAVRPDGETCGHKVYFNGALDRTEGEGF